MNPRDQHVAIAEALGWKDVHFGFEELYGTCPKSGTTWEIPDFLNNLNACHEMEKVLKGDQPWAYQAQLIMLVNKESNPLCMATAAQRCESFLKTLGLWKDALKSKEGQ